jgi:hypothetical protein
MLTYNTVLRKYGMAPEFCNIPYQEAVHKRADYPFRPELAESRMHLYRATEDPTWLSIAADLVDVSWLAAGQLCCRSLAQTIEYSTRTKCGYATVENVRWRWRQWIRLRRHVYERRPCRYSVCTIALLQ